MFLRFCVLIPIPIHIIIEEESKIKNYTFVILRFTFDLIATVASLQGESKVGIREAFILKTTSILLFQSK